jgi:hypothetical protein
MLQQAGLVREAVHGDQLYIVGYGDGVGPEVVIRQTRQGQHVAYVSDADELSVTFVPGIEVQYMPLLDRGPWSCNPCGHVVACAERPLASQHCCSRK